jgi:hypothetical protein
MMRCSVATFCGSASVAALIGVAIAPGAMLLTRILCWASSTAAFRISIRRPPFATQYEV